MITHSRILVWRIPWTEEPGGLQSKGWQRVGHDRSDLRCTHSKCLLFLLNWLKWCWCHWMQPMEHLEFQALQWFFIPVCQGIIKIPWCLHISRETECSFWALWTEIKGENVTHVPLVSLLFSFSPSLPPSLLPPSLPPSSPLSPPSLPPSFLPCLLSRSFSLPFFFLSLRSLSYAVVFNRRRVRNSESTQSSMGSISSLRLGEKCWHLVFTMFVEGYISPSKWPHELLFLFFS